MAVITSLFGQANFCVNSKTILKMSVLFVFLFMQVASGYTDYCSLCHDHTLCNYRGLGQKCGYSSTGGYLTENEKKSIVDTHNSLRSLIATGGERRGAPGPQPPATDMQILKWDDELAKTAQAWADQCDFGHDSCRSDPRFLVGQNVFLSEGGVPWDQAIISWYSEVEFFDKNLIDNFIFDEVTGHFTQMVWGNTRYIGCGKRTYPQKPRKYKRDTHQQLNDSVAFETYLKEVQNQNQETDNSNENARQARRIDHNQYYNQQTYSQQYTKPNQNTPRYDSDFHRFDSEWQKFNRSVQQYMENNKGSHQAPYQKKQLQAYDEYLREVEHLKTGSLTYEEQVKLYESLQKKYIAYQNLSNRQQYYDQKLKTKLANKKKLNPFVSKNYAFSTEHPIIAGVEYEYYVCNYGPIGNYPGARMYTRGSNLCPYYGLCSDPMTRPYYPSLDQENDPALSILYSENR